MANSTTIKSRIIHCTKTSAQWASTSTVALKGELLFEVFSDGSMPRMKMGDGTSSWENLPYLNYTKTEIQSWISQASYNLNPATATILGGVMIGSNISVTNDGTISVEDATTGKKGVVQLSDSTSSNSSVTAATSKAVYEAMQKAQQGVDDAATAASAAQTAQTQADKGVADAAAAQATANAAMPKSGGTFTGAVTLNADPTTDLGAATKKYVDQAIVSKLDASMAMHFKGSLGTGGTVTTLPTDAKAGDLYKVLVAGTYAGQAAKVGDIYIALKDNPTNNASGWVYIPAGDEVETFLKYSTTTTNLTTTAKSGEITLAEGAVKQVDSTISAGSTSTNLPTSSAVASFVEGKGYKTADENVKQTASSTSGNYPILASEKTSPTSGSAQKTIYNTGVTINPNTKTITATTFAGKLSGKADSAGTADTAGKLSASVNVSATGLASGDTTTFDGSSDLNVNIKTFDVAGLTQQANHYLILDGNFS